MLCFEVSVNGEKLCVAGLGDIGCLTSILSWAQVRPEDRLSPKKEWRRGVPNLRIGGLVDSEHLHWLSQNLAVGDEVTIRIIESSGPDEPSERYPVDLEAEKTDRRRYNEWLKHKSEAE